MDGSPTDARLVLGGLAPFDDHVARGLNVDLQHATALKTTSLGGAIRYTLGIWDRLTPFVDHPEVWLDNNSTERGIRGPVLGRRNHFGSKSARGTEVAAILYTLVESAKASGIDPIANLTEVVTHARESPGAVVLPEDFVSECCAL